MTAATGIARTMRDAGWGFLFLLTICAPLTWSAARAAAAELIMVRQPGCSWCARWDKEVGAKYASSAEGRAATLREVRLGDALPAYIRRPVTITPTFILVDDGREVDRIVGYPGESFFWEMLAQMLSQIPSSQTKGDFRAQPRAPIMP